MELTAVNSEPATSAATSVVPSAVPSAQLDAGAGPDLDARADLSRLLFDGTYERAHKDIRDLLADPVFDTRAGLTANEAGLLAYERARVVHGRLERPSAILADPERLFALAEWPALADVAVFSILMVHYNLCFGTVVDHGSDRPDIADLVEELDSLASFGPYMATELGYGNNVAALETEAVYDPETDGFILNTPGSSAQKYMSYSGFRQIPKIAVVMARVKSGGADHGVFPFLVRLTRDGELCEGIRAVPCPEKPVQGLDNGLTWFDHVPVPKSALLHGAMGSFGPDGAFQPTIRNQRRQFLKAMSRILPGRLCVASSAAGAGRASVYIALRYAAQRMTNAPGRGQTAILGYRSHQLPVLTSLAKTYAMTFLLNSAKREYLAQADGVDVPVGVSTLIGLTKALVTWEMTDVVAVCRERCGAQGIFSVNRIADYGSLLQGLVTAEGDNLVLISTAAAQLLAGDEETGGLPEPPDDGYGSADLSLDQSANLLRYREAALARSARESMDAEGASYFESWNNASNAAVAMARVRGARLAVESLGIGVAAAADPQSRTALELLARLYATQQVNADGSWYARRGLLSDGAADDLPATLDRLCAALVPHVGLLTEAMELTPELLRAPIAADDYVEAFIQASKEQAR